LLVAPTGSGKTYLGLRVAHEALLKGRRALFVCDRTALINQTSARADDYGLTAHGIVQANHWRYDKTKPFQIASLKTLEKRNYWPEADVIIIDEAHTQYKAWTEHLKTTNAAVIGLTATPCSDGLGRSFSNMVNAATMNELTESGVLVPLRAFTWEFTKPDMAGAETSGGEWTDRAAAERETQIIGDVVAEWVKHGEGRKTIAFGADIAYCESLVQRFNEAGILADTFTSQTPQREREYLLKEFTKPDSKIRILVSVEALAKGFDVQDIGCVIDARPLRKSFSTALQMWGRGLRSSPNTGKKDCRLHDHSGNFERFVEDYEKAFYYGFQSLDMSEKMDAKVRDEPKVEAAGCPACGYKPFHRRCLSCGHEKQTLVIEDSSAGEMREIRIGKKVIASDNYDLWRQLCAYARGQIKPEKQPGWAWYRYQDITGEKPPRTWNFEATENAEITRGTMNKIKSLRIAFIKGKRT
jgi:superfamily II DNA or RNA helicase